MEVSPDARRTFEEAQRLEALLDEGGRPELPPALLARLAEIPAANPRSSNWRWLWPFASLQPLAGWAVAAAVGIAVGAWAPESVEAPSTLAVALETEADAEEAAEWDELTAIALAEPLALEE